MLTGKEIRDEIDQFSPSCELVESKNEMVLFVTAFPQGINIKGQEKMKG